MAKKRFSPEQVVAKLRQIEVLTAAGKALPLACKEAGITMSLTTAGARSTGV